MLFAIYFIRCSVVSSYLFDMMLKELNIPLLFIFKTIHHLRSLIFWVLILLVL